MHLRRTTPAAVAALVAGLSLLVAVTTTPAYADVAVSDVTLPPGPVGTFPVMTSLSGDTVLTGFHTSGIKGSPVYVTAADGSGTWAPFIDPVSHQQVSDAWSMRDGVVIVPGSACTGWRVITTANAWDVPGCAYGLMTGAGGRLVAALRVVAGVEEWDVYDAVAGPANGVLTSAPQQTVLAGSWVWSISGARHRTLVGHDTTGAQPDRTVALGDACSTAYRFSGVAGDPSIGQAYAKLDCGGGVVVPLDGSSGLLALNGQTWALGPGLLFRNDTRTDGSNQLVTQDLSTFPTGHTYSVPVASVADAGSPRATYLGEGRIHVLTLPPAGPAPSPADDTTPPRIVSEGGSPAVVRGPLQRTGGAATLSFRWAGSDDEVAPLRYTAQVIETDEDFPQWHRIEGADGTFRTRATYGRTVSGGTFCFRVRATDRVGNRSPWSAGRCVYIDGDRPWMRDGRFDHRLTRVFRHQAGRVHATYRFHGRDDDRVASYDVEVRSGHAGSSLGAWRAPRALRALSAHRVATVVRPDRKRCFRARARDRVGRVSGWGDPWCVVSR
jgi:hypothetical protein